MKEFKNNKNSNTLHSPIVLIVLFVVLFLLFFKVVGLWGKVRESNRNKEIIINQLNDLKEREEDVSMRIDNLDTEEGIEQIIREKYKVVKEGEKMVVIVKEDSEDNILEEGKNTTEKNGFIYWIKSLFVK